MTKTLFTIDGGNTNLSVGIHSDDDKLIVLSFEEFLKEYENQSLLVELPVIYSSVKNYPEINQTLFPNLKAVPEFNGKEYLGMPVHYSKTIGIDRLIGSLYCFREILNKDQDKLALIDAGTFITVDFISAKGLEGGFIFPGLELLRNTYSAGEQLHIPERKPSAKALEIPHSTEEAIHAAYSALVQAIVDCVGKKKVVLTGGNSKDLEHLFEDVHVDKNLMHNALRCVLNYEKSLG